MVPNWGSNTSVAVKRCWCKGQISRLTQRRREESGTKLCFFLEVRYTPETQEPTQHCDLALDCCLNQNIFLSHSLSLSNPPHFCSLSPSPSLTLSQNMLSQEQLGRSWVKHLSQVISKVLTKYFLSVFWSHIQNTTSSSVNHLCRKRDIPTGAII